MAAISKIDMDNGSFPLAKDALRTLAKTKLSGAHRAIIDVIWLETYGWYDESSQYEPKLKKRKTSARIPYQTFINETYIGKTNISCRVNELINWGVILRDKNTNPYTYSFNVNADQWDPKIFRGASVARPDDTELCEQITVMQTDNSYEDSKQGVMRIDNKCYEDSEQQVMRIDNSYAVESPEILVLEPLLNNTLNNLLNNPLNNYIVIFNHWNAQKITVHKYLTEDIIKNTEKSLTKNSLENIMLSIKRYSEIYHDKSYYFKHKWSLVKFLTQRNCIPDFLDEGDKWVNYQDHIKSRASPTNKPPDTKNDYSGRNAPVM
jgi:hypothetical protein